MRGSGIDNVLPRVTVMVPTYNQAEFLEDAVASALAQDYPNLEVVISDDGSTDQTPAVVERLAARDPRVRAHRSARNIGRVANYRRLLYELATGDWVINLDGDDCFASPTYLGAAVRRALSDPAIALVFGKARKGASLSGAATLLNDGAEQGSQRHRGAFGSLLHPADTVGKRRDGERTTQSVATACNRDSILVVFAHASKLACHGSC